MQSPSSIFEPLFKRDIAAADSNDFLTKLAEEHPYFSPAQFFLLQQKEKDTEEYNKQAAKTSVLFNNAYWLNFQLLNSQRATVTETSFDKIESIPVVENIVVEEPENKIETVETIYEPIAEIQTPAPVEEAVIPVEENIVAPKKESLIEEKELVINFKPIEQNSNMEDTLIFEPLHTSDYFASQGIKLNENFQPTDKLGKQLKSFTDWLKTMKKINTNRLDNNHSEQTDNAIQNLAEKSNTQGEVLTETMAEVFIQQGKAEKAVEVYEKLSLLNPSKKAYFASKIQQLKEQ